MVRPQPRTVPNLNCRWFETYRTSVGATETVTVQFEVGNTGESPTRVLWTVFESSRTNKEIVLTDSSDSFLPYCKPYALPTLHGRRKTEKVDS